MVEIVDTAGKVVPAGESGEIVVTHLFTSEFPFVRYRTGDVGTLSDRPCACGRGLPVLASVEGAPRILSLRRTVPSCMGWR